MARDTTRQLFLGSWADHDSVFLSPLKYSGCESRKGHKSMTHGLGQHRKLLLMCWATCVHVGTCNPVRNPTCLVVSSLGIREQHLPSCAESSKSRGNLSWKEIWVKEDTGKK